MKFKRAPRVTEGKEPLNVLWKSCHAYNKRLFAIDLGNPAPFIGGSFQLHCKQHTMITVDEVKWLRIIGALSALDFMYINNGNEYYVNSY